MVYWSEMTTNRYQNTRCHIPEDNHACCIKNSRFFKPNLYQETFPSQSQTQMYEGFGLHFLHVTSGIPTQSGLLKCSHFSQWRFSIFIVPYIVNLVWCWRIFATEWIWLGWVTRPFIHLLRTRVPLGTTRGTWNVNKHKILFYYRLRKLWPSSSVTKT